MIALIILLVVFYLLLGGAELIGIAFMCMTTGEPLPSLIESLLIIGWWGYYEWKTWRRKHSAR